MFVPLFVSLLVWLSFVLCVCLFYIFYLAWNFLNFCLVLWLYLGDKSENVVYLTPNNHFFVCVLGVIHIMIRKREGVYAFSCYVMVWYPLTKEIILCWKCVTIHHTCYVWWADVQFWKAFYQTPKFSWINSKFFPGLGIILTPF